MEDFYEKKGREVTFGRQGSGSKALLRVVLREGGWILMTAPHISGITLVEVHSVKRLKSQIIKSS
jgi:hypothetical protein